MADGKMRKLARRFGVELGRYPRPESLPGTIKQVVHHRRIDAAVDVGGHWGEFATTLRNVVAFEGPIVSFEPSAANFEKMNANMVRDELWTGQRAAVGAERGRLDLHVYRSTDLNSFRRPSALGLDQERFDLVERSTETVDVVALDDIDLPSGRLLLKTDTQGFDLEVLRGAVALLGRVEAIVIELPVRNIYAHAPSFIDIVHHLSLAGFELLGMHPVARDDDRLRVIEFDGLFISTGSTRSDA